MTFDTFTRPGCAGITIGHLLFTATRYTGHQKRLTGIFADIGPWRKDPYRAWFVEIVVLGFGIGVCR